MTTHHRPPAPRPICLWLLRCLASWLTGIGLAVAARTPAPVPMRLPDTVQPQAYQLHLVVDPAQPRHSGEVQIDLRLHQALPANGAIRLHAQDLLLQTVWLETGARRLPGRVVRVDAARVDLRFGRALPAGPARLVLAFTGALQDKDVYGLFRQRDGGRWGAYTQFQATGARLAFPLFDEPGWKVPWTLSLTVPDDLSAVANMPVRDEAPDGPGRKRLNFEPTPPLPSYLLAFAVGDFDLRDGGPLGTDPALPLRFITPRGQAARADLAARITGPVLQRLEAWFGLPYPYAKLDSLAIPVAADFGAMEHAGLVTYAAPLLLATPAEQTAGFERRLVVTTAHELAHQWFGNLVTMAWWDDLWLNESFASWLGDKVSAEQLPAASLPDAQQRARARAMQADRLLTARAVQQPVLRDEDMGQLWDAIVYEKGQTVLGMFEAWLGPARFQAGVQRYLQRHAWGLATSADFYAALAVDDPTLPDALRSFVTQPGIPRVQATLLCDDGPPRLRLQQSRLLPLGAGAPPAAAAQRWQVPVRVRTPAGSARLLLAGPEATLALPDTGCPAWVQANADGTGYYRVAYAGDGLARLAAAPGLPAGEAQALLDDAQGLHDAGDLDTPAVLALVQAFAGHPAAAVAERAAGLLQHLRPLAAAGPPAAYAQRWQAAFGDRARALGWAARPDDTADNHRLRQRLVPLVADLGGDEALRQQALALARAWLADPGALPAALRAPVLATAARQGDEALFDGLLAALHASTERPLRQDLLAALGAFTPPALARRARALLLDPAIDLRDSLGPLLGAQGADPALRGDALAFVSQRHADLARRLGRDEPASLPGYFASGCSADEGRALDTAFSRHAARYTGGRQALAAALEAVRLCSAWRARQAGAL